MVQRQIFDVRAPDFTHLQLNRFGFRPIASDNADEIPIILLGIEIFRNHKTLILFYKIFHAIQRKQAIASESQEYLWRRNDLGAGVAVFDEVELQLQNIRCTISLSRENGGDVV